MFQVVVLTILFSLATVASILLLGSRTIISDHMDAARILHLLFSWQFIVGAVFAFLARLFFMMINSALFKMPSLADSSTTITTLITTVSLLFVIVANYFFLNERISITQALGAVVIFIGIFLVTR
jgi:drug/metabolite transporter (DMT)-like permease